MRRAYLEEHRSELYERILLSGKPYDHLAEISACCSDRMALMIRQLADEESINEDLKARDQLAWGGRMNSIRHGAEESVLDKLVFV